MKTSEKEIKEAIKHFESVRDNATVVLENDFGTKTNESDLIYRKRKKYAELAIQALEKQIPKKTVTYTETKQNRREHMENRYLFKAKRIDNKEWVTGALLCSKDEIYKIVTSYLEGRDNGGMILACAYDVDESTICQCTGLKDENGKLICENDIVDRKEGYPEIVKYKDGDWTIDYSYAYDMETGNNYCNLGFYVRERKCIEVIGNIFDNPELLESEESKHDKNR